jgi:hypothetical protein
MQISEVLINGVCLDAHEWCCKGDVMTIRDSAWQRIGLHIGDTCTVTYRYDDPETFECLTRLTTKEPQL